MYGCETWSLTLTLHVAKYAVSPTWRASMNTLVNYGFPRRRGIRGNSSVVERLLDSQEASASRGLSCLLLLKVGRYSGNWKVVK
jgi:hypothetical protein